MAGRVWYGMVGIVLCGVYDIVLYIKLCIVYIVMYMWVLYIKMYKVT
jgi:hypothetical protein